MLIEYTYKPEQASQSKFFLYIEHKLLLVQATYIVLLRRAQTYIYVTMQKIQVYLLLDEFFQLNSHNYNI